MIHPRKRDFLCQHKALKIFGTFKWQSLARAQGQFPFEESHDLCDEKGSNRVKSSRSLSRR